MTLSKKYAILSIANYILLKVVNVLKYYDGSKLLSMQDINGNKPELYFVTTNRTGGKTTFFRRYLTKRFLNYGEKFMLIYRYRNEIDNVGNEFFKDIQGLFFPNNNMTSKSMCNGVYHELFLDEKSCGYAVALNSADTIKKLSHFFSDVDRMLMDEFQAENGRYCTKEIEKFVSIHTSVARGRNKQSRYVPVYLLGNPVTLLNPYYTALGISHRLRNDTKFLRGEGWVVEQGYNAGASKAQSESAFNRAFAHEKIMQYQSQGIYLQDSKSFIEQPTGKNKYVCTIRYNRKNFSIREFSLNGYMYCDDKADLTYPLKISVTTEDFNINYVMLKQNDWIIKTLRSMFDNGLFRFKNLECKEAIMEFLAIR